MARMKKKRVVRVYLGRFSPFQRGHQTALGEMIERFGVENCLVLIGSINTRNERTPYTFEQRGEMIQTLFPEVEVLGLPDGKPNMLYFDGSTNDAWLDSIETIQNSMEAEFIFYGGSKEDLQILSERFKTEILTDRSVMPQVTATNVRAAITEKDEKILQELLDPKIVNLAIEGYEDFINYQKANGK